MAEESNSTQQRWRRHVQAWRESGLSGPEYAQRAGVVVATLRWWAWRLGAEPTRALGQRRSSAGAEEKAESTGGDVARFVELVVGEQCGPPTTVVVERDGIRVTFPASASAELIVEVAVGLATRAR